jgi:hypothetical protein
LCVKATNPDAFLIPMVERCKLIISFKDCTGLYDDKAEISDSESIFILFSGILYVDNWVSSSSINGDIFSKILKTFSISVFLFIPELLFSKLKSFRKS